MKRAIWNKQFGFTFDNKDLNVTNNNEVLVKILMCGICGSDIRRIKTYSHDKSLLFGHEIVGIVDKVGDNSKLMNGLPVGVKSTLPCGKCRHCLSGKQRYCLNPARLENLCGFADYLVVPQEHLCPITSPLNSYHVLLEPLAVALELINSISLSYGMRIGVSGAGTIGLLATFILKTVLHYDVILISDHLNENMRLLLTRIHVPVIEYSSIISQYFDVVFSTSGYKMTPHIIKSLSFGGSYVTIGYQGYTDNICSIDIGYVHKKNITIKGCFGHPQMMFEQADKMISKLETSLLEGMLSPIYSLDNIKEAFSVACDHEYIKVIVGDLNAFQSFRQKK